MKKPQKQFGLHRIPQPLIYDYETMTQRRNIGRNTIGGVGSIAEPVAKGEPSPFETLPGLPSLCYMDACANCGRTILSAVRPLRKSALCGRCYQW